MKRARMIVGISRPLAGIGGIFGATMVSWLLVTKIIDVVFLVARLSVCEIPWSSIGAAQMEDLLYRFSDHGLDSGLG